jgi:hypothetical protein
MTPTGCTAITGSAASASQMGRFETKWLSWPENLAALADLSGQWIDKVQQRRLPRIVMLDMDSSRARPIASRKAVLQGAFSAAPATIRCSCSTSSDGEAVKSIATDTAQSSERLRQIDGSKLEAVQPPNTR